MNAKSAHAPAPAQDRTPMDASARMLVLRGTVAILFGVLAVIWPDLTLMWLVALFAVYALVSGGAAVGAAIKSRRTERQWWLPLLLGIVSIAAGICALVYPALTALVLVLLMGANAIVTGALDIAIAIRLRKVLRGQWLLVASGIVSVLFGALVFAFPGAGALALVWLISLHAIVTGILLLSLGWRTRRAAHEGTMHEPVPAGR